MSRSSKTAKGTTKGTAKSKVEKKTKAPSLKYGIKDLADALGIVPASVRVRLRNRKIAKKGGRYGWDTKAEMAEVAEALATDRPKSKKSKKGED